MINLSYLVFIRYQGTRSRYRWPSPSFYLCIILWHWPFVTVSFILSSISYVTMRASNLSYNWRSSSCSKCRALFTLSSYALIPHMLNFWGTSYWRSTFFKHLWYVRELSPSLESCSFPCFSLFNFPANYSVKLPNVSLNSIYFFLYYPHCLVFSIFLINIISIVPSELNKNSQVIRWYSCQVL